jgi:peptidoglycan/xylan/chitin deacetylase (PgdA/CDA1 family)
MTGQRGKTGPIPYRSARTSSGWRLPEGARLAIWVVPNVEFFPLDHVVPGGEGTLPDVPNFARRDYGARVGFWRLLDAIAEVEVRATVALNSDVCEAYPEVVSAIADSAWEVMGHCGTNSRRLSEMNDDEERRVVTDATSILRDSFGGVPRGWLGAGLQERWTTLGLLSQLGYDYVADWTSDDRPNLTIDEALVAVPYSHDVNDYPVFQTWRLSAGEFTDLALRQVEVLWREGRDEPRVLGIALHPFLIGVPHRIDALRRMLDRMRARRGIWWATGSEIASQYKQTVTRT